MPILPRGGGGGAVAVGGAEDLVNDGELVEVVQGEEHGWEKSEHGGKWMGDMSGKVMR